jgi:hypothetical protein
MEIDPQQTGGGVETRFFPPLFVGRLLGRQILHNLLRQLLRGHVRGVTFRQNAVFWVGKDAVPKLVLL